MSTPQEQAQAHADLLLSTGMAYEITPHTIAYRAFLDGYAAGASDSPEAKRLGWALDHPEKFHDLASDFMQRYTPDAEANAKMISDGIDSAIQLDTYP